ncbi:MAG: Spy/CpxP family protein refolding chaperone [Gemmatimonadota bacterium]
MKLAVVLLSLLAIAPLAAPLEAQSRSDAERRAQAQARRDALEAEVLRRFVERLDDELDLTNEQRAQTERILAQYAGHRRDLNRASVELRGSLHRSLRSRGTDDTEFTQLLAHYEALRTREQELWRREQAELAAFFTPRQRVEFIVTWTRFQDTIREIMSDRSRNDRDGNGRDGDRREHDSAAPD